MLKYQIILWVILLLSGVHSYSQEEESAEVYLEEYTDEFQELFFEALKQKGIENYDKAANLLLECKLLEKDNSVIDHELAVVYLAQKEYVSAQEYGLEALVDQPDNFWYLNTLVSILQGQGLSVASVQDRVPYQNRQLKENLAMIYYNRRNYSEALKVLKELDNSSFASDLSSKIRDSIDQVTKTVSKKETESTPAFVDPSAEYKTRLNTLISEKNYSLLEDEAAKALELFPSQPYFYYVMGMALGANNKHLEATRALESALDFLLVDVELANLIFKELADAYGALGNSTKANMYLSKIKNGS